jgi:hypothetical protein
LAIALKFEPRPESKIPMFFMSSRWSSVFRTSFSLGQSYAPELQRASNAYYQSQGGNLRNGNTKAKQICSFESNNLHR